MKKIVGAVALLLAVSLGTFVWAGAKTVLPVTVNLASRQLSGSLGSARNSGDSTQYIQISHEGGPGYSVAWIVAQSASGAVGYCFTSEPNMVAAARAATDGSYIFTTWDVGNNCSYVSVQTSSTQTPKIP